MVQVVIRPRPDGYTTTYWWRNATGTPEIHVHFIERNVFGNGIGIRVYGEMKIASGEIVYAREMKLNCLQVLNLTPEYSRQPTVQDYCAKKWIYHKSEFDNWASIDIYEATDGWEAAGSLPSDGSIWLDFIALGE